MTITGLITTAIMTALTACMNPTANEMLPNEKTEIYADCGAILEEADVEKIREEFYQITFTMQNGNRFAFYAEDGDWMVGDLVSAVFDDRGTPAVTDDEILSVRYSGHISDEEIQNWIK